MLENLWNRMESTCPFLIYTAYKFYYFQGKEYWNETDSSANRIINDHASKNEMFGFLVSRIRNYIALSLLLKLMIELNLAHDPMRKDFLSRMKTNIQLKVLVLVTYQKSYMHFRSRNISPWIYWSRAYIF